MQYNPNEAYNLESLTFYISKKLGNDITPFLLIEDSKGVKDIFKLTKENFDRYYNIYSVSLANTICVEAGESTITLLLIGKDSIKSAKESNINISYNNFTIGRQIQFIEEFTKEIRRACSQVEEMTRMNIQIHQEIEEVLKDDYIQNLLK